MGSGNRLELSVVMPVHNEAPTIEHTLTSYTKELQRNLLFELVVAEDGSTDGTQRILRAVAKKIPFTLVTNRVRRGYGTAVSSALKRAQSDLIFFSDSDGQYSPGDFWKLYDMTPKFDLVVGRKLKRTDPLHRILLSRGFHLLVRLLFGIKLYDCDCGYRIMRRKMIDAEMPKTHCLKHSFWAEFTIRAVRDGFRVIEVPISHQRRLDGSTRLYQPRRLPRILVVCEAHRRFLGSSRDRVTAATENKAVVRAALRTRGYSILCCGGNDMGRAKKEYQRKQVSSDEVGVSW
jgi:glycosyltransferase involved in cell wall biosynthesis